MTIIATLITRCGCSREMVIPEAKPQLILYLRPHFRDVGKPNDEIFPETRTFALTRSSYFKENDPEVRHALYEEV